MGNRDGGVFLLKMSKHSLSRLEEVDEGVLPVATAVPATDFADRIDWQSVFFSSRSIAYGWIEVRT